MQTEEFARKVMGLMPQLVKAFMRYEDNALSSGTITFPQFCALLYLSQNGKCKMKELASHLDITPAAATGLIDRLIHQGMVSREDDANDRRIVWIVLSQKGRTALLNIEKQRIKSLTEVFGRLSEADRAAYLRILEKIVAVSPNPNNGHADVLRKSKHNKVI